MSSEPARRRGRPRGGESGLTREGILATALALVDEHGLAALTMRRLAGELSADPMSIYHHLPNKAAIVAGLVQMVFAELRLPDDPGEGWEERVRAWARAYRDLATAHPHLVLQIVTDVAAVSQAAVLVNEPLYAALEAAGLRPQAIVHAAGLLVDFVNGHALAAAGLPAGEQGREAMDAVLAGQDPQRVPVTLRVHAALVGAGEGGGFEAGLDIVVAGVRATATRQVATAG